jgi:hypothetical protein
VRRRAGSRHRDLLATSRALPPSCDLQLRQLPFPVIAIVPISRPLCLRMARALCLRRGDGGGWAAGCRDPHQSQGPGAPCPVWIAPGAERTVRRAQARTGLCPRARAGLEEARPEWVLRLNMAAVTDALGLARLHGRAGPWPQADDIVSAKREIKSGSLGSFCTWQATLPMGNVGEAQS